MTTENADWTGGFWIGLLLWAYETTRDEKYRDEAFRLLPRLEARTDRADADFDLGFLLFPSFVRAYEIWGDEGFRDIALRGAERMLEFFHPKARLIHTVYPERESMYGRPVGTAIVDIMMNLSLLWWAGRETNDPRFVDCAREHAECTSELFVREDGSTFHALDFDLASGDALHKGTIHGRGDDTTWARGQAWALHGFAFGAQASGDPRLAERAEQLSRFFLARLPDDARPYWDLDEPPADETTRDTSAAAIAAAAWVEMGGEWRGHAEQLVETLVAHALMPPERAGILNGQTAYFKQGRCVEEATIWGDYYLVATLRALADRTS